MVNLSLTPLWTWGLIVEGQHYGGSRYNLVTSEADVRAPGEMVTEVVRIESTRPE